MTLSYFKLQDVFLFDASLGNAEFCLNKQAQEIEQESGSLMQTADYVYIVLKRRQPNFI